MRRKCRPGRAVDGRICDLRTASAFSLLELVVVLAIVSILAAMAIPRFAGSVTRQRVDGAARRLAADIELARNRAGQTSAGTKVVFSVAANAYQLNGVQDPDRPGREYAVSLALPPFNVNVISADFGGDTQLQFDGYGCPDSGGSVTIGAGDCQRTVTIDGASAVVEVGG
jgi:prepilin-type N-terminal cleavage/methylation domain-containing protein